MSASALKTADIAGFPDTHPIEVSIVMPCLNEADTIASCIGKAHRALKQAHISGEVIVADNGSEDGSDDIARKHGARVLYVSARGYGNALKEGIAAAKGRYIIMGDADDSYDFLDIPKFVDKLRSGCDLVQGCRLPSGGGVVLSGAMPPLHRWIGNPLLTFIARCIFKVSTHDVYCGLRGFTKTLYERLSLKSPGMEFATEMIIKARLHSARITEVPITLYPDGRKSHASHLKTFRDGWRTLRLFLLCSPRWLFVYPGLLLLLFGTLGYAIAMPGVRLHGINFGVHTLLFSSLALLLGYQSTLFGIFAKTVAINEGILPEDKRLQRFLSVFSLEKGIVIAFIFMLVGLALSLLAFNRWQLTDFGAMDYPSTMRVVIPGVTLTALGFQTLFSSFLVALVGHRRN